MAVSTVTQIPAPSPVQNVKLASGMRAQGVAAEIGIQTATVYTHVRNVVLKLEVDTRTQAVAIATKYAFLDADPETPSR